MRSQWNDDEDEALQGLTPDAQVIYLRGFRRYMNYATGVAGGPSRKLSYKALSELIAVDPDWGSRRSRGDMPSRGVVRARVAELERAGLIVDHGSCRAHGLVFLLPLADAGSVYPEKEQPREQPTEQPEEQPSGNVVKHPICQQVSESEKARSNQGSDPRSNQRNDTHLFTPLHSTHSGAGEASGPWSDDQRPEKPNQWGSFLARERRWAFHHVLKPKLMVMYQQWSQHGLSVGDVRIIMEAAEAQLGRVPDGPEWYRRFAEKFIAARERSQQTNQQGRSANDSSAEGRRRSNGRSDQAGKNRQFSDPKYAYETW